MELVKQYYMNIYATAFSPDGEYLAAGNSYGKIAVFYLTAYYEPMDDLDESYKYPIFKFEAHSSAVYSLISAKQLIISGSTGVINAWHWNDVKNKEKKLLWQLIFPYEEGLVKHEVNSMSLSPGDDSVFYAGCGDNKIYCINIETGTIMFSLAGHTDFIHCVKGKAPQECVSASEDGSVRLWDARKGGKDYQCIVPHNYKEVRRPDIGKWMGCAVVDESNHWLICGGAPALFIWDLRRSTPILKLYKDDITHNEIQIFKKDIISGGSEPCFNFWGFDGQLMLATPTSASHVFGLSTGSSNDRDILSTSGCGPKIDISSNFRYRDFSLIFTY